MSNKEYVLGLLPQEEWKDIRAFAGKASWGGLGVAPLLQTRIK